MAFPPCKIRWTATFYQGDYEITAKMSRKTAIQEQAALRQLKNVPNVFHFCPFHIVKARVFSVKIYSHFSQICKENFFPVCYCVGQGI